MLGVAIITWINAHPFLVAGVGLAVVAVAAWWFARDEEKGEQGE